MEARVREGAAQHSHTVVDVGRQQSMLSARAPATYYYYYLIQSSIR